MWRLLLVLAATAIPCRGAPDAAESMAERAVMVRDQIVRRGIEDPVVISAMRNTPRHAFVPESLRDHAYEDRPLPIGFGQTISQPYIVAYMTELIGPRSGMKVLEIGTGSGYQAAVLAEAGVKVYSIEIIGALARRAAEALRDAGYGRVVLRSGDGYYGWEEAAPFDAIIVTAAAEAIPPPLLSQLANDGVLIIPVGPPLGTQYLVRVSREDGRTRTQRLLPVRFVPFVRNGGS
ncbi:MAG: protein-L-isoaspartate(D-aspartate) O-methyltransferase [Opitutaceae bacterium]